MNQEIDSYDKKTIQKKNWNSENILYLVGVQPDPRKNKWSLFHVPPLPWPQQAFQLIFDQSNVSRVFLDADGLP